MSPVAAQVDLSVVIAGLGLRLAPTPHASGERTVHPKSLGPDEGRVFVTELTPGGAAERPETKRRKLLLFVTSLLYLCLAVQHCSVVQFDSKHSG